MNTNKIPHAVKNTMESNTRIIRLSGGKVFEDNRGKCQPGNYGMDFYYQQLAVCYENVGILRVTYYIAQNGEMLRV